jgi:hypothetical protein
MAILEGNPCGCHFLNLKGRPTRVSLTVVFKQFVDKLFIDRFEYHQEI